MRRLAGGAAIEDGREAGLTFETERGYEVTLFVDAACRKDIVDFASLLAAQCRELRPSQPDGAVEVRDVRNWRRRSLWCPLLSEGENGWSQTILLEQCSNGRFGASNK